MKQVKDETGERMKQEAQGPHLLPELRKQLLIKLALWYQKQNLSI